MRLFFVCRVGEGLPTKKLIIEYGQCKQNLPRAAKKPTSIILYIKIFVLYLMSIFSNIIKKTNSIRLGVFTIASINSLICL